MSIYKNMQGKIVPLFPKMCGKEKRAVSTIAAHSTDINRKALREVTDRPSNYAHNYLRYAKLASGTMSYTNQVNMWVSSATSSLILTEEGLVGFPVYIYQNVVRYINLEDGELESTSLSKVIPILLNKLELPTNEDQQIKVLTAHFMRVRNIWLSGRNQEQLEFPDNTAPTYEGLDDFEASVKQANATTTLNNYEAIYGKTNTVTSGRIATDKPNKSNTPKEEQTMSKTTQVLNEMKETNIEAAKSIGYLNAGRASNKAVKEAMRPLLGLMFKPSFMQRFAMKLFGMQNPVDAAMNHVASDLVCAEVAKLIFTVKGVENDHLREINQAGIVYAGMKISDEIPLEETVDAFIAQVTEAAKNIGQADKK